MSHGASWKLRKDLLLVADLNAILELFQGHPVTVALEFDERATVLRAIVVEGFAASKVTEYIAGELRDAGIIQHSKMLAVNDDRVEGRAIGGAAGAYFPHRLAAVTENRIARHDPGVMRVILTPVRHGLARTR